MYLSEFDRKLIDELLGQEVGREVSLGDRRGVVEFNQFVEGDGGRGIVAGVDEF